MNIAPRSPWSACFFGGVFRAERGTRMRMSGLMRPKPGGAEGYGSHLANHGAVGSRAAEKVMLDGAKLADGKHTAATKAKVEKLLEKA